MLESVSDLVSLIVMIASVLAGIYYLYSVSNLHRSIELKKKKRTITVFLMILVQMKMMRKTAETAPKQCKGDG